MKKGFKKGFLRIFIFIGGIWSVFFTVIMIAEVDIAFLILILLPVLLYFVMKWILEGFE